jgi:hypothetical protein
MANSSPSYNVPYAFPPQAVQNALIPIHKLPEDLLIDIFRIAISQATENDIQILKLASVCADWRLLALGTPILWAALEEVPYPLLPLFLTRSAQALISVSYKAKSRLWNSETAQTISTLLFRHAHRIRRLHLALDEANLDPFARQLAYTPMPSLESLRVGSTAEHTAANNIFGSEDYHPSAIVVKAENLIAPRLNELAVKDVRLSLSNSLLFEGLRRLVLEGACSREWESNLFLLPHLEELELVACMHPDFQGAPSLPKLRSLEMRDTVASITSFLERAELPALLSLSIEPHATDARHAQWVPWEIERLASILTTTLSYLSRGSLPHLSLVRHQYDDCLCVNLYSPPPADDRTRDLEQPFFTFKAINYNRRGSLSGRWPLLAAIVATNPTCATIKDTLSAPFSPPIIQVLDKIVTAQTLCVIVARSFLRHLPEIATKLPALRTLVLRHVWFDERLVADVTQGLPHISLSQVKIEESANVSPDLIERLKTVVPNVVWDGQEGESQDGGLFRLFPSGWSIFGGLGGAVQR